MALGHFKTVCTECQKVVSNCRCGALDKRVIPTICRDCNPVLKLKEDDTVIVDFGDRRETLVVLKVQDDHVYWKGYPPGRVHIDRCIHGVTK